MTSPKAPGSARTAGSRPGPDRAPERQPASVPQTWQKRAPATSGAPQPEQRGLAVGTGGAAGTGAGAEGTGAAGTGAGAEAGTGEGAADGAGAGATSDAPHFGHATHRGSSMTARQAWQRPGANGSAVPQNGQAAMSRWIQLPQRGHGCL